MNYLKRPFHPTANPTASTNTRETLADSSTSKTLTGSVRFNDLISQPKFNEREKYLTAKYPQQQMQLIRKRLKVEFWLDDQLRSLYEIKDDCSLDDHDHCPGDLIDSLLDLDDDAARRTFLLEKLRNVNQPRSVLLAFIEELLDRVKIL